MRVDFGDVFFPNTKKPFEKKAFKVIGFEINGEICMIWSEDGTWLTPDELEKDYKRDSVLSGIRK